MSTETKLESLLTKEQLSVLNQLKGSLPEVATKDKKVEKLMQRQKLKEKQNEQSV